MTDTPDPHDDPASEVEAAPPDDPEEEVDPALLDTSSYRLTDKQALAALGGYLLFRTVTTRVGIIFLITLTAEAPWAVPLLNNSSLPLVTVGISVHNRPLMQLAVVGGSLFLSLVAGLVLYWAGWRFGPELARRAESGHVAWSSLWNPKQVARAHRWLDRWGVFAVAVGKLTEIFTAPVVLVAGSSRMHFGRFISSYLVGSVGFVTLTLWLGSRAAVAWPWLPDRLQTFAAWNARVGIGLIVLLMVVFLLSPREKGDAEEDGDDEGAAEDQDNEERESN